MLARYSCNIKTHIATKHPKSLHLFSFRELKFEEYSDEFLLGRYKRQLDMGIIDHGRYNKALEAL